MNRDNWKDLGIVTFLATWWWALLLILGLAGTLIWLALQPTMNNLWIKGWRTTNEYQTTKVALIYSLKAQYEKNEVKIADLKQNSDNAPIVAAIHGQQRGLIDRMNFEVSLLDNAGAMVPDDIRTFLATHKE